MNKIITASLITLAITSANVFAASETYQATITAIQEPTLTQTAALNFGSIAPNANASCVMDNAGEVSGQCDASDANILMGEVTLADLVPDTALTVTVTGSSSANLTFASVWDVNSAATGSADGISDSSATNITVDNSSTDITLDVYGSITVDSALTSGDTYAVDYTVDVVFQ